MLIPDRQELPADPIFRGILPVLCALWADGEPDNDSLTLVRHALRDASWMNARVRALVVQWLNPDIPPSATMFAAATDAIRVLDADRGCTLTEAAMASAQGAATRWDPADPPWLNGLRQTLTRLEEELGLAGARLLDSLSGAAVPPPGESRQPSDRDHLVRALQTATRGDQAALRERVRSIMHGAVFQFPRGMGHREYRERTLAAVQALADAGLGSMSYPRVVGGQASPALAVTVFEELAYGDLSVLVKFGVQFGLFGGSIAQLGTERHHRRYLARVASLDLAGCYAMTETGHGSNVRDLRTVASYDPAKRRFLISTPDMDARKDYIGNAALHGQVATVFARLCIGAKDHGVHAFLVRIRDDDGTIMPGVEIEDCGAKVGLNGVDNGRLYFTDVAVPAENLLDRFAQVTPEGEYESAIPSPNRRFFTMLGTLVAGRVSIAVASVSVAKKGLAIAVRYAARRRQFGPQGQAEVPVLSHLDIQRQLIPRLATTYALTFGVSDLVRQLAAADFDRRTLEVRAATLKAIASRHAMDTLHACREACGGQGYLAENQLGRLRNDTDVFTTFEGANPVLLQLAAKGLLSGLRKDMGDMGLWSIARHLAKLAKTRMTDMNPVTTRRTDPEHLGDLDVLEAAMGYREQRLLRSAARRLRHRMGRGMDSFDAVNECQDHLIALALAHGDRVLMRSAARAARALGDGPAKDLLMQVVSLFGITTIERERAWYLEKGYIDPSKSEAMRDQANRLCHLLADRAVDLVDGFGIPNKLIRAPIAQTAPGSAGGGGVTGPVMDT